MRVCEQTRGVRFPVVKAWCKKKILHLALFSRFVIHDPNCKNCQNNMMTSSWCHFEYKKLMSLTNNTPSFTSVELLVWQKNNFEKCTFKTVPHDALWRHQAKTPQISCYYEGDYVYKFWNNYHKLCHSHIVEVYFEMSLICR